MKKSELILFEKDPIRRKWDKEREVWYFSIIDIIKILTQSPRPRKYWNALKTKLKNEGSELSQKVGQLKLESMDGKKYLTDVADTETLLRLIQSIPSKKTEPVKLWLARVGYERIQEIQNPENALNRSRDYWKKMGRSKKWIQQRMMGQEIRNKLTDYWAENDVKEQQEFAILTNIIHSEWSGLTVAEHKQLKKLESQNLRDHMSDAELVFTALAELSTRQLAETQNAKGLKENIKPAKQGGRIAKNARLELESKTKKRVVTGENYLSQRKRLK